MATKIRPILIEIPEELQLQDDEIRFLERAFRNDLALVEPPGPAPVPDPPVNTTRLPLEIEVVSRSGGRVRRTRGRAPAAGAAKKGGAAKGAAKKGGAAKKAGKGRK